MITYEELINLLRSIDLTDYAKWQTSVGGKLVSVAMIEDILRAKMETDGVQVALEFVEACQDYMARLHEFIHVD